MARKAAVRVKRGFQLHLKVEKSKLSLTMQVMSSATKEGVRTPGRRERRKEGSFFRPQG